MSTTCRIVMIFFLCASLLGALVQPVAASGEQVRGELTNWETNPWAMSGSLGGTFIYTSGQVAAADDSVSEFKFFKDSNQWYGNGSTLAFGTIYTNFSTSGGDSGFNHIQNRYYVFKWNGDFNGVIFQLTGAPSSVNSVNQAPASPTSVDAVTVTATLSAALPAEQTAWLHYAINGNWGASTVSKMSCAGTSCTATIPAQSTGTAVAYYVFTSGDVASISGADADLMTITYNTNGGSNYAYTVTGGPLTLTSAKALWLDTDTIAWNGIAGASYKLLYDPDGGMTESAASTTCVFPSPAAPCYVSLTASGTVSGFPKNPNATGLTRLTTGLSADDAKHLLKGEVGVASYTGGGALAEASRVQHQSVLDALYAASASPLTLGVTYSGGVPSLRVWAPTAKSVTLRRFDTASGAETGNHAMTLDAASGTWSVTGDASWDRKFYLLDVEVYVPLLDAVNHNLVTDPYSVSLSQDGSALADVRSQFVNLADADLKPAGWDALAKPALANPEDIVVYEVHVRDFSINDTSVTTATDRGTYKAFTYDGTGPHPNTTLSSGMDHLKQLQAAGLTHIHLLPAFDIASVIEPSAQRTEPSVPAAARDSDQQQTEVGTDRATDGFNWGYDPYHYGLPEGSYATNPDGVTRILEFRDMVSALNQNGLRVVMDVVYNHTADSGMYDHSVLDKVVPGYYFRYDTSGSMYTSSCCSDTASEYAMFEKLMKDTLLRFAVDYKVDGFRFDLMNLHTRQNMLNIKTALQSLTVPANGVDGSKIYLYGEGWDFGSALAKGLTACPDCYAKQYNMTGTGIGTFNDKLRDAAHGGYNTDSTQIRKQGYINGLGYDWNGYPYGYFDPLAAISDLRTALAGSGGFYTDDPQETINYVEKHDNETLFDQNVFKLPIGTSMADRVRVQNLGTSLTGLAQGVPFFQMGQDILRSKSLDRNSYDSGDWFNRVFWDRSSNNFGQGLPPAWDNSSRWGIMGPLLADAALDPTAADMNAAAAHMREILRIRNSSALFRLTTEADANARISFYNTTNDVNALIVMALSDIPAPDLDSAYESILVFFNANKFTQTYTISGANGFNLHSIQADATDADPVVQAASFNDSTDTFSIPARTTAVFVSAQALQSVSSLDWVGRLWPRGGVANQVAEGAAPAGLDVFVQVYESGWTEGAGGNANIACTLHWGRYGAAWQDLPMTWNVQSGHNDEYMATIPQATLNALAPGTYGFTANCNKTGESPLWKQDAYNINANPLDDDQGDGLITVVPASDPRAAPAGGVFVHLFEWTWPDVEKECTYLAQKGYSAVQVSPPNEHIVPTADQGGDAASDFPWWARYQPVTHDVSKFTSRSGTWAEFQSMVSTCNSLGVDVYVDAVINHMAFIDSQPGTAGTVYDSTAATRYYGTQYAAADFHADCDISDYKDRNLVQTCKLSGLPDLDTGRAATRDQLRAYLQSLIDVGVLGFRIDGAKHIAADELEAVLNGLTGDFYVFQEVIDQSSDERIRDWEYAPTGDVTEFAYPFYLGDKFDDSCGGTLSQLQNLEASMLPARFAQVFTDNHDNQRGHGVGSGCVVDHRDGQEHVLANIFALAYPYGYPSVMSSYYWQSSPTDNTYDSYGPPTTGNGVPGSSGATLRVFTDADAIPDNCAATFTLGKWTCEHRRTAEANMVGFRWVTRGQSVTNWQNIAADHIAFGLGAKGFVAINQTGSAATPAYQTGMPEGIYCDIVKYDFLPASGQCVQPGTSTDAPAGDLISVSSSGQITTHTLAANDAFAIHAGARMNVDYGDLDQSYGLPWHTASGSLRLGAVWRTDDGVTRSGVWGSGSGGVQITVNGAAGYVTGWVDWNQDGDFADTGEQVFANEYFTDGQTRIILFSIPVSSINGATLNARFRLYPGIQSGVQALPSFDNGAAGGEVEDYAWAWSPTAITLLHFAALPARPAPQAWLYIVLAVSVLLAGMLYIYHRRKARGLPW